jgi:spore germination cell wall hydrolase CwlJ-like protein
MKCLLTISLLLGLFAGNAAAAPSICKKEPLACNVYFESRGEKEKGQYAVAFVSVNRLKNGSYGQSMRSVVFSKGQFSWTNSRGKINDPEAWAKAREIARNVHHWSKDDKLYRKKDLTRGALYFRKEGTSVQWNKKVVARIGKHIFYA